MADRRRDFFRDPKIQTLLVFLVALLIYIYLTIRTGQMPGLLDFLKTAFYTLTFNLGKVPTNVKLLLLDLFLFGGALLLWLAFFAQFILPVRTVQDRYEAVDRLLLYSMNAHGPAVFVEDGEVRLRRREANRRGPGLIYLDSASAAVLRNDVSFTRPVGPGVVFTPKNEYLAQAVDLHIQAHPRPPLGPLAEEDPFAPQNSLEDAEMYAQRKERRLQTSGLTRDGVEVVPNISAVFQLERLPGDNSLTFGYNPDAVLRYVTSEGVARTGARTSASGERSAAAPPVELRLLPAYLAVDLWREYLQRFTLNDLFSMPAQAGERVETAFWTIRRMVQERLTKALVEELDPVGHLTGRSVRSREYEILKAAGIQVLGASISNVRLVRPVEETMQQQWVATWMQRSQLDRELVESRRSMAALSGREDALLRFARAAIRRLDEDLLNMPRPQRPQDEQAQMRLVLERMVHGNLVEIVSDPILYQRLTIESTYLSDLIDWIRVQHV